MNKAVNLQELAIQRTPNVTSRRPRTSLVRFAVPMMILAGFAGIALWSFRDILRPPIPVTVVPVMALRSEVQAVDTPLFRTAGWIEPRPTPVIVSSLIDGIVSELCVIEGQEVQEGDPLAELMRADAEISLRQAKAELELKRSSQTAAEARFVAAEAYLGEPIERIAEVAAADSELAKVNSALSLIPAQSQAALARLEYARQERESKTTAGAAIPKLTISKAESEVAVAEAAVAELAAQKQSLSQEQLALTTRRDTLKRQLDLKIEEKRQFAESQAAVEAAKAEVESAAARLAAAQLQLSRTTIRAPITGKVLSLEASPGRKLMGLSPASMQDASTILTMYDPAMLQVRADVRLEDVPQLLQGQKVQIATPAVSGNIMGRVVAITSTTDIQKNTLQVKVALDEPPAVLKPGMLVQAVFLAPPVAAATGREPPLRLAIPRNLIDTAGEEPIVWIADRQTQTARRRIVTLGPSLNGDLVEITAGVSVGDRIIAAGRELLHDQSRVSIRDDDSAESETAL